VQRAGQLGPGIPPPFRPGDLLPQTPAVVNEHAALDGVGVRAVSGIRLLTHHVDEVSQPAVILGQVARRWADTLGHLLAPRRSHHGHIQPRNAVPAVNAARQADHHPAQRQLHTVARKGMCSD
jgi:hypothetical protein